MGGVIMGCNFNKVQTRRHQTAQKKHDKQCGYSIRMQFKKFAEKWKSRGE